MLKQCLIINQLSEVQYCQLSWNNKLFILSGWIFEKRKTKLKNCYNRSNCERNDLNSIWMLYLARPRLQGGQHTTIRIIPMTAKRKRITLQKKVEYFLDTDFSTFWQVEVSWLELHDLALGWMKKKKVAMDGYWHMAIGVCDKSFFFKR